MGNNFLLTLTRPCSCDERCANRQGTALHGRACAAAGCAHFWVAWWATTTGVPTLQTNAFDATQDFTAKQMYTWPADCCRTAKLMLLPPTNPQPVHLDTKKGKAGLGNTGQRADRMHSKPGTAASLQPRRWAGCSALLPAPRCKAPGPSKSAYTVQAGHPATTAQSRPSERRVRIVSTCHVAQEALTPDSCVVKMPEMLRESTPTAAASSTARPTAQSLCRNPPARYSNLSTLIGVRGGERAQRSTLG